MHDEDPRRKAPFLPIRDDRLFEALAAASVCLNMDAARSPTMVDLGSGDGRANIHAAKALNTMVQLVPLHCPRAGVQPQRKGDRD